MKNLVVVGGGTAGWLTALYAQKANPEDSVVLVESDKIGILGAGEGTVPGVLETLSFLDISINDLIKNCNSTIKNGIVFKNWSSYNDSYMHPFLSFGDESNDSGFLINPFIESDTGFSHIISSIFNHKTKDFSFMEKISNKNLLSINKCDVEIQEKEMPFNSSIAIHFDASLLAQFLRSVGEKRGILRKEGIIKEVVADQDGYIQSLYTDNEKVNADFVFDCTGLQRLIIGNFYKSKWKSYKDSLPVNSAIPFFLPIDKNIPPYTESIAMDYGWMWKIPLQSRYGCGYVFDNDMISLDSAKKELDSLLGFEVESPRTFNFNAGIYKEIWVKNCLAVGLSAGFMEPLEATSIWQAAEVLKTFFSSYGNIYTSNEKTIKSFNYKYEKQSEEILEFLYLHYVTDKKNTDFWKNFTKNNKMPDFIKHIVDVAKERPLTHEVDFFDKLQLFPISSFYYVMLGNNILTKEILQKQEYFFNIDHKNNYLAATTMQDLNINNFLEHNDFLTMIKEQ